MTTTNPCTTPTYSITFWYPKHIRRGQQTVTGLTLEQIADQVRFRRYGEAATCSNELTGQIVQRWEARVPRVLMTDDEKANCTDGMQIKTNK